MDDVDIAVLRAMGMRYFGPRTSRREDFNPAAVADRVGLDPKTVRTRIARMQESGFLDGFDLYPNPRLFGIGEAVCYVHGLDPEEKEAAFGNLESVDRLLGAHDFFKGPFCVLFTCRDDADRDAQLGRIEEAAGRVPELAAEGNAPAVASEPSALDWRVIALLRHDALMPAVDVAKRLGVTARTVRRRLERLTKTHAYYIFPRIDPTKGTGLVFAGATVWPEEGRRDEAVSRARQVLAPYTFLEADAGRDAYYGVLGLPTPADAERLERALARTDGVARAETNLLQRSVGYAGWLDETLEEHAGRPVAMPESP